MSDVQSRTLSATGLNASCRYLNGRRQIGVIVDEELFNIIKAEAIREGKSISELVRGCIELVLR